jgi:hypothetical protein
MRALAVLLVTIELILVTSHVAADVVSEQGEGVVLLKSGDLVVRYEVERNTVFARRGGVEFINGGKFSGTQAKASVSVVDQRTSLGDGKAIVIKRPHGVIDRISLLAGTPLVCFRRDVENGIEQNDLVDRLTPVELAVPMGRAVEDVRVLGCDGLTAGDKERASYTFIAAADPGTRAGVVAGWLTNDRGSGIALSKGAGQTITISGRVEYGKLLIPPGQTARGETFAIGRFEDCLVGLETYADAIAKLHQVKLKPIPSGYCTWYSRPHGGAADEKSLAQLADFACVKLAKFGFEVVQIDDKWQLSRRDFTDFNAKGPYPSGMKLTAGGLVSRGLTPGLWLIPFGWDPKRPVFEGHQDYFVKRKDGSLYEVKWAGTCLDMTHPGARELLKETVERMTREWGFKYLKIDGLWTGLAVEILYPQPTVRDDKLGDAVFHDRFKTNVDAYRDGLKLVREAAGDDVFILGCNIAQNMRTLGASFGLVDAMRVGRDIGADWKKIVPSMQMGTRLYFLHGRVWHNDPDCLMLREPLTVEQARAWGSWIALSGQLNMVSEWLPGLPEERLEVVRRTMPNTGLCGRPLDLFDQADARVWKLTSGEGESRRDVVGLFNWDDKAAAKVSVPLVKLGLPERGKGGYVGFDFWGNRFVEISGDVLEMELPPGSCRVISIVPAGDRPRVVSTSRHVTQGVVDLRGETWDGKVLSGVSRVVGGDDYEIRIAGGAVPRTAEVSQPDQEAGVTIAVKDHGPNARVVLKSPANREVRWGVGF